MELRSTVCESEGSDVYAPWQAHVYAQDESKGIMENRLKLPDVKIYIYTDAFVFTSIIVLDVFEHPIIHSLIKPVKTSISFHIVK